MTTAVEQSNVYGFARPTSADAVAILRSVFGGGSGSIWVDLLGRAAVTSGDERLEALQRIAAAGLAHEDPAVSLCGRAMQIRIGSFQRLGEIQRIVAGAA